MSMTVQQRPDTDNVHGAFEQLMYVLTSTEQAGGSAYKFRYIADLYVGGSKVARVKVYPNTSGAGVFRVDKLIQDFMSATKADQNVLTNEFLTAPIHNLGANSLATTKSFSPNNGETFRKVEFKFGQEFSASAVTNPTVYADVITGEYISVIMSGGLKRTNTWDDGIADYLAANNWLDAYIPKAAGSFFLSDRDQANDRGIPSTTVSNYAPVVIEVSNKSKYTLGMLMDADQPTVSDCESIWVGAYNSSDSLLDSFHFIPGTHGGTAPGSVSTDAQSLQYFGCGPLNLSFQTSDTSLSALFVAGSVSYYEVIAMGDTTTVPANATSAVMRSTVYRFNVIDPQCSIYQDASTPKVTIAWQNSFGAWDYQMFNLRYNYKDRIKRKTFDQAPGNWNTADAAQDFNFRGGEGGIRVSKVEAHQELTATTDLWNEQDVALLETLLLSPNVILINDVKEAGQVPILVTDSSFVKKRNVNERGPFLYQIQFKYAKQRPTTKGGTYRGYA